MLGPRMETSKPDFTIQRRWPRYKVELRLKVKGDKPGQLAFAFGQGSDVSEGGMAAYIPAEFEVGDSMTLEVQLPYAKESLLLKAAVRNRNGFRYGLEYTQISDEDRQQLGKSIKAISLVQ